MRAAPLMIAAWNTHPTASFEGSERSPWYHRLKHSGRFFFPALSGIALTKLLRGTLSFRKNRFRQAGPPVNFCNLIFLLEGCTLPRDHASDFSHQRACGIYWNPRLKDSRSSHFLSDMRSGLAGALFVPVSSFSGDLTAPVPRLISPSSSAKLIS